MRATEFLAESQVILEDPNQVKAMIMSRLKEIQDEEDLVDILKYANRYSFKSDVSQLADVKGYSSQVSDVIMSSLGNVTAEPAHIKSFIKKLTSTGIINAQTLLQTGVIHNLEELIDKNFIDIFNQIKRDLFEKISGKIGEVGDVGKGEYLFSILSPQIARRGAPGDLNIAGKKVELKAGESGRLGPCKGQMPLSGRFEEFIARCEKAKFLPAGSSANTQEFGKFSDYNFSLNMNKFCQLFDNQQQRIVGGLKIMLDMHFPGYSGNTEIAKTCVKGGSIDGYTLKRELLGAAYATYQAAKNFDGVILIDYGVSRFLYVNTIENVKAIGDFVGVKYPSWTDTQSNTVKFQLNKKAGV
jgi:hypothetical protein